MNNDLLTHTVMNKMKKEKLKRSNKKIKRKNDQGKKQRREARK